MKEINLTEYFDGKIEFHTKLHTLAKEAMIQAYEDKSIDRVTQWGNIMSEENTIVMTLQICKRDLVVH